MSFLCQKDIRTKNVKVKIPKFKEKVILKEGQVRRNISNFHVLHLTIVGLTLIYVKFFNTYLLITTGERP